MTKKKNRLFTFCCSLLPGAGEMYLGFFKHGVSTMALFFLLCMALRQTLFSLHAGLAAGLALVLYLTYKITDRMER